MLTVALAQPHWQVASWSLVTEVAGGSMTAVAVDPQPHPHTDCWLSRFSVVLMPSLSFA